MSRNRLSNRVFVRQELHNGAFVRRRALCDVGAALLVVEGGRKTRQPLGHGLPPCTRPGARGGHFSTPTGSVPFDSGKLVAHLFMLTAPVSAAANAGP